MKSKLALQRQQARQRLNLTADAEEGIGQDGRAGPALWRSSRCCPSTSFWNSSDLKLIIAKVVQPLFEGLSDEESLYRTRTPRVHALPM
jgi:hypothetical protein